MGYGREVLETLGRGACASADGLPVRKVAGVTIDWDTVPSTDTDATLEDETVIPAGVKYLPFGVILTKITSSGKYGPYNAGASDGRQTPARGSTFILNRTVLETDPHAETPPDVCSGGAFYRARLKIEANDGYLNSYTNTGAFGTSIAAALPGVEPVDI